MSQTTKLLTEEGEQRKQARAQAVRKKEASECGGLEGGGSECKAWACQVAVKRTQMAFQTITSRFMHLENY